MERRLLLFLLCCSIPCLAVAGILKGKVKDNKGEALPFATVYIQGTTMGTSANAEGEYQLTLPPGKHTVLCQYISYQQDHFTVTIEGTETVKHDFVLQDQNLKIKEHVVKASEDPALYIMRKAIARRSFHLNQIKSFETGIYLKGVFKTREAPKKILGQKVEAEELGLDSNRKGILYLCEEVASFYTKNGKKRTVIHSVRESGDPKGLGFSQLPPVISFYESNIHMSPQLTPRGFISPLNEFAFNYYRFRLEGDFEENGHTIYKIRVTPKRLYEPLFDGSIYIVDNEWAIHSLNLLVTKKSNLELLDTLRIEQVHLPLHTDTWVIKQQVLYPTIKIFGFDLTGNFVTVYNDQKVNHDIPDSLFNEKVVSSYDQAATKKDTSYWTETRPLPLLDEEIRDYVVKDSIRLKFEDPAYVDSMRRRGNRLKPSSLLLSGYSFRGREDRFSVSTNSLVAGLVNYNTIEGVNVAPKFNIHGRIDSSRFISGALAARYGFSNTHFNSIGKILYTERAKEWKGRQWSAGIEAGKYVFQFNSNNPIGALFNTVSTLFFRENHIKLYERWNGALLFSKNYGTGLRWNGRMEFQQRIPLENSTDFSFVKSGSAAFTENIPDEFKSMVWEQHNAVLAKLSVSYQPGFTYTQYPEYMMPHRSRFPVFSLSYEKGIPNMLESKTDFDKWRFAIRDDLGLKLLGDLSYNVATGGFLNSNYVSVPDLNHLNGNQLTIASSYLESFQLAPYYKFSNSEPLYGEAHVEWYLRGFITNKIPLLRQLRWYLVTGSNAYYASENLYHVEYFAGIDNLGYDKFRLFRLDVVQSWNSLNQRTTGIRIGVNPAYIRFNLGENSEW